MRCRQEKVSAPLNLAIAATVFAVVFPAELPDKTALASLVLGSRYRPVYVFTGVALAFAMHVVLAVAAGSLIALLPRRPVEIVVSVLFAVGAVVLLRGQHDDGPDATRDAASHGFLPVAATSFAIVAVAEFGDLTQIVTASLAARYASPLSVGVGAVLALWSVGLVAILGGRSLLKVIPLHWITRLAAAIMLVLAVLTLITALT